MSIASEITRLQNAKASLKTSINAKTDAQHQIDNETLEDYSTFVDSITTGGGSVEKGVEFSNWDSNGYPQSAEIKGLTVIPTGYLYTYNTTSSLTSKLTSVTIPNNVTSISANAFTNCVELTTINFPSTLTVIGSEAMKGTKLTTVDLGNVRLGDYCFQNCKSLKSVKCYVANNPVGTTPVFYNCTALKKACFPKVTGAGGGNASNGCFNGCTSLKQIWLGDKVGNNLMFRYAFYNLPALEKVYINKPRATIEGYTNYAYAFMNDASKQSLIICNDDTGFITEEQFDALDPDTM